MLKSAIKALIRVLLPPIYWSRELQLLKATNHEPELALVPLLAKASKISIDVGAAGGIYVARMLAASRSCVAFEPIPSAASSLETMARALNLPVRVERVALSSEPGRARMRVLVSDPGRSTIESENDLEDPDGSTRMQIEVPVRKLDDYLFDSVGFLKIDVEGHETAVIQGALRTITEQRPNVLVEAEDRHKPEATKQVFELMRGLDYAGYFLHAGTLIQVEEFDRSVHQNSANISGWKAEWKRTGVYINNFIFVPKENAASFISDASRLIAS